MMWWKAVFRSKKFDLLILESVSSFLYEGRLKQMERFWGNPWEDIQRFDG